MHCRRPVSYTHLDVYKRQALRGVGHNAGTQLYLSWDTAVSRAYKRYQEILKTWPGPLPYNSKNRWV